MSNESAPNPTSESPQQAPSSRPGENAPRRYPCAKCGARLEFAPGTDSLSCPYCGNANTIVPTTGSVAELDYEAELAALASAAPMRDAESMVCTACAATVTKPAHVDAMSCPYCGSNIVATGSSTRQIKPRSLLPFKVTRQQADSAFRNWIKSLWFAPSALRREGRLDAAITGLYIPFWTYDCDATTRYRGQRGEYYYVTETYTETVNGQSQTRTRQVRRTRWYPAAGTVFNQFDDLLVLASRSLPQNIAAKLEPWDLPDLIPYSDDYLSGFVAENYQIDLPTGFETAKEMTLPTIDQTIRSDIGGDEQQIDSRDPRYSAITYKHMLLPVWISSYRYMNKVYHFYVNARSGEVSGDRPYSWWKITFLVLFIIAVIAIIALFASHR